MEKLVRFIGQYIWMFIACFVVLYLLNRVMAFGSRGQVLLLALVATLVPVAGDYLLSKRKR